MTSRRRFLATSSALVLGSSFGMPRYTLAEVRSRVRRVVVGFPPGGAPDVVARIVADQIKTAYGSGTLVDNRPGAAGRIAAEIVKNSDADGTTMLVTPNPIITLYPHVYRKIAYDALIDFAPVTSLCSYPLMLTAGPGLPASIRTLEALVGWARANPASATFGTPAAGSTLHFAGLVFARSAGIELLHVPYRGGPEVINDLLGARVPLAITPPAPVVPHIRAGKLRALATTSRERMADLPEVPTFRESGYPNLDMSDWIGLFMPSGTPAETVNQLNDVARAALRSTAAKETLAQLMMTSAGESPQQCARKVAAEYAMWRPIVTASGFVIDE